MYPHVTHIVTLFSYITLVSMRFPSQVLKEEGTFHISSFSFHSPALSCTQFCKFADCSLMLKYWIPAISYYLTCPVEFDTSINCNDCFLKSLSVWMFLFHFPFAVLPILSLVLFSLSLWYLFRIWLPVSQGLPNLCLLPRLLTFKIKLSISVVCDIILREMWADAYLTPIGNSEPKKG